MEWNYTWISLNFTIFLLLWSSTFFQRSRASSSSLLSNPREPYPRLQLEILERFGWVFSMEIGWSGSRDEWGDSKSLSGHPWCGWSEAISFWIWQGRPCYPMLCHAIHCPHFSWKRLKSHHLYTCWESCRIWTLQKCVISWQLFERARWRCTASERSYYC